MRGRRRARAVATVVVVGALALAGCVAPKDQVTVSQTRSPSVDLDGAGLEQFYDQSVEWSSCGSYECAWVQAPLDWDDPAAGAIELALQRAQATGSTEQRIGSLLINPGGPGSSGIDFLDYLVTGTIGDRVRDAYDVVAFDPRGVGQSTAISCGDDATLDAYFTTDVPLENQDDVDAAREMVREFGETCLADTGPLLGNVDTVSAARDMDLMRAVLGEDELYYLGFSYGTFLGATYAELYPENVGRLVLDGALDPSISGDELSIGQAIGFENALRAYVEDCQAGPSCPLSGGVDSGLQQLARIVDRIEAEPIDAGGGQTVNGTLAFYGIIVTLYDDASWSLLTMALQEVVTSGTGETLLHLANFYLDRTPDGRYTTNSMQAFTAINCLDYPPVSRDYDEMVAFAEEVAEVAPTFGRDFGMAVGCEAWPVAATGTRGPIHAAGAAPIVVIGTTGDPATPYEWSVELADQLESGVLVSWDGEGHTAYGRAGACVTDAVEDYLVDGVVPEDGLRC